jgi:hypothetical protein
MAERYWYDIFISYSHRDRDWVIDWLLPRLEEAGLRVCIDFRDFDVGVPSLVNMERAVERSCKTLIVLTPDWVRSEWTNFEGLLVQTGDPAGLRNRILPLMLKRCEPPKRIGVLTYADFTSPNRWESELHRIIYPFGKRVVDTRQRTRSSGWRFLVLAIATGLALFLLLLILPPDAGSRKTLYQVTIPLSAATSQSSGGLSTRPLSYFFAEVPSDSEVDGIQFYLTSDSPVIETESWNSSNPAVVRIPVQKDNVLRIHLLINMSYGAPKYVDNQRLVGEHVARVQLISGEESLDWELEAGRDIREWVIGSEDAVNKVANYVTPILTGTNATWHTSAVIDHLLLQVPNEWQDTRLDYIVIEDRSEEVLGSPNPGILVFGITVEYLQ